MSDFMKVLETATPNRVAALGCLGVLSTSLDDTLGYLSSSKEIDAMRKLGRYMNSTDVLDLDGVMNEAIDEVTKAVEYLSGMAEDLTTYCKRSELTDNEIALISYVIKNWNARSGGRVSGLLSSMNK